MEKEGSQLKRGDELLQLFKKGEEFSKELLRENERLRLKLAHLEDSLRKSGDEARVKLYEDRIKILKDEITSLNERFRQAEEENKDFVSRHREVEEENNNLANLYVASYQLHSTLDFSEVMKIVLEIVINLIGAERFAVLLIDEETNDLVPVAAEGIAVSDIPRVRAGEGRVGAVARDGESYFAEKLILPDEPDTMNPIVCIPLKIKERVIGVISIYMLMAQKKGFADVDYELFNLLAGHAATAIFASRLCTLSEGKPESIQGAPELLKNNETW